MKTFSFSFDNERFQGEYATREEALAEGVASVPSGEPIWTGANEEPVNAASLVPSVDRFLENLCETASDEFGEVAEDWPHLSSSQKDELAVELARIAAFLQRVSPPTFYRITDIEEPAVPDQV